MLKRRFAIVLAVGALATGLGVASAFADNPPSAPTATATDTSGAQGEQQNGQQGVDEQGAANNVEEAANAVQTEAGNQGPDDQNGDQQNANDQSEEQGDDGQSGDQQSAG